MASAEVSSSTATTYLSNLRNRFTSSGSRKLELEQNLIDILPLSRNEYNILTLVGSVKVFKAVIECNFVTTKDFIKQYCEKSKETLRTQMKKSLSDKNEYSSFEYFRCQHKTFCPSTFATKKILGSNPSKRIKNNNCPFSLIVKHRRRAPANGYAKVIEIEWTHNHSIRALQTMTFNDINVDTKLRIVQLFEKGYTPSLAHKEFIRETNSNVDNDLEFHIAMSDRSKMPRRSHFNLLFKTYNENKYGTREMSSIFKHLKGLY